MLDLDFLLSMSKFLQGTAIASAGELEGIMVREVKMGRRIWQFILHWTELLTSSTGILVINIIFSILMHFPIKNISTYNLKHQPIELCWGKKMIKMGSDPSSGGASLNWGLVADEAALFVTSSTNNLVLYMFKCSLFIPIVLFMFINSAIIKIVNSRDNHLNLHDFKIFKRT